jgi:hypothetical protein
MKDGHATASLRRSGLFANNKIHGVLLMSARRARASSMHEQASAPNHHALTRTTSQIKTYTLIDHDPGMGEEAIEDRGADAARAARAARDRTTQGPKTKIFVFNFRRTAHAPMATSVALNMCQVDTRLTLHHTNQCRKTIMACSCGRQARSAHCQPNATTTHLMASLMTTMRICL